MSAAVSCFILTVAKVVLGLRYCILLKTKTEHRITRFLVGFKLLPVLQTMTFIFENHLL